MNINELIVKSKKHIANLWIKARVVREAYTTRQQVRKNKDSESKARCNRFSFTPIFWAKRLCSLILASDKRKLFAAATISISIVVSLLYSFPPVPLLQEKLEPTHDLILPVQIVPESVEPQKIVVRETEEPEQLPVLDLSSFRVEIESNMRQINEPTSWGEEVLYSAGEASSIDGPVLTRLFLYNSETHEEKEVAVSDIRFGEIYEGRLSDSWIVWLDTNQSGTNIIYALNRTTGKNISVNSTSLNRPQISLWGDFLVWSGQKEEHKDEMHVFNLATGRSVRVENFDNPTYGTSSPSVHSNLLVWAYPHPDDPIGASIIKTLDLTTLNLSSQETEDRESQPVAEEADRYETVNNLAIQTIDPDSFAIYPATNGKAIAWLDSLNPAQASLRLTIDKGETITTVAEGVGRFFGIGEDFIVYTQQGRIKIYFWETSRFATLTKEDEQGKLAELPVSGRTIIWYDATDPNRKQDIVKRSVLELLP